jgi:tRNA (cmo5U34)-methyltransferase
VEDPIGGHPTRGEQLDVLVQIVTDLAKPGDAVLDLGCGTGYLEHLLEARRDDLALTGVDRKGSALDEAHTRFGERVTFVEGDLTAPTMIQLPDQRFRFIVSALTFHDLTDAQKQAALAWARDRLSDDGLILVYDRIRLDQPTLFPAQQAIWRRIERVHGAAMRTADSFAAYETDLSSTNRPARLDDYRGWFSGLGMASQVLHLHGNVGLIGAAPL